MKGLISVESLLKVFLHRFTIENTHNCTYEKNSQRRNKIIPLHNNL